VNRGFGEKKNLRKREHLEDPNIDGRITLKWIFNIQLGSGLD